MQTYVMTHKMRVKGIKKYSLEAAVRRAVHKLCVSWPAFQRYAGGFAPHAPWNFQ